MSATIRAAKSDGSAVWTLLAISFAYGIFHAAGPGHGKAVISSYLVANEETARRGIVLSFASALLQALVAVALVAVSRLAALLHRQDDVLRGEGDRDRKLCPDRGVRRPAGLDQGRRFYARAAGEAGPRDGRRGTMTTVITTTTAITIITAIDHHHDHGHRPCS